MSANVSSLLGVICFVEQFVEKAQCTVLYFKYFSQNYQKLHILKSLFNL